MLQLQRVRRPLPLPQPHPKQPLLMAEGGGNVGLLADALTRQLLQRKGGCASVSEHGCCWYDALTLEPGEVLCLCDVRFCSNFDWAVGAAWAACCR
jgi:hypothetical protein